jgi:tRNA G18 (ribose-2'-O)-methylase SpoU
MNGGTLIFGNEEFGISNQILSQVDHLVEIPLVGLKNSLNVANAFSIIASAIRNRTT